MLFRPCIKGARAFVIIWLQFFHLIGILSKCSKAFHLFKTSSGYYMTLNHFLSILESVIIGHQRFPSVPSSSNHQTTSEGLYDTNSTMDIFTIIQGKNTPANPWRRVSHFCTFFNFLVGIFYFMHKCCKNFREKFFRPFGGHLTIPPGGQMVATC